MVTHVFFVYILRSQKSGKYYIGSTQDLAERVVLHNLGKVVATHNKGPWSIIYTEKYSTRSKAYRRELEIKSYKGGNNFKKLINGG